MVGHVRLDPSSTKLLALAGLLAVAAPAFSQPYQNEIEKQKDLTRASVQTKSENDLDFLRSSIEKAQFVADDDEKEFPAFCAELALGMRGTSDSLATLRKIPKADLIDAEEIRKAIQWMESNSTPIQALA